MESGIFFVFLEVCSLSDLVNIADPDQVLRHAASGKTIMFRDVSFLFNNKIMFADSEGQGRKRYFMKIKYLGKCKEYGPRSNVTVNIYIYIYIYIHVYIVGNISLKKFDIFLFTCFALLCLTLILLLFLVCFAFT